MFENATRQQKRTAEESSDILCLGCGEAFDRFDQFQRHRYQSDHPDQGEVYR